MKISCIDTPALIIDYNILQRNLKMMALLADSVGIKLRPHIKTHKINEIALEQITLSDNGITVAKLSEAEVMSEAGINDILIANEIIGEQKIRRLSRLCINNCIQVCVDSSEGVNQLEQYLDLKDRKLGVLIEIDTGMNRCGLSAAADIVKLARLVINSEKLQFRGILSHSGNIYSSKSREEVQQIAEEEVQTMCYIADELISCGIKVTEVSIGSTPAAIFLEEARGITEFRPGNYVFNDNIQVSLGVTTVENCALTVISTVISKPTEDRIIIDTGSKCLGLDKGVHGSQLIKGHGLLKEYPEILIERLSEEHGILRVNKDHEIQIGDRLTIIPNHACSVMNLFDDVYVVKEAQIYAKWQVVARGKVT
ncbi:MAG: alanine racemase [Candidatus Cloacimonetes bacterium]|nr:alanine racemase [Candidatus Cloacimonadota bacterium]